MPGLEQIRKETNIYYSIEKKKKEEKESWDSGGYKWNKGVLEKEIRHNTRASSDIKHFLWDT